MQSKRTTAIILRRINYGEADRIITLLTRDFGKLALIAKGVRKEKSKLAGGIELMSESDISFLPAKSSVGTLVSTQLIRHFSNIHTDLERMRLASTVLKRIDRVTEDDTSSDYYDVAVDTLLALNSPLIPVELIDAWYTMRLMLIMGEVINVEHDAAGRAFNEEMMYRFSFEENRFFADEQGDVEPNLIKFIRLLGREYPEKITGVRGLADYAEHAARILNLAFSYSRPE